MISVYMFPFLFCCWISIKHIAYAHSYIDVQDHGIFIANTLKIP